MSNFEKGTQWLYENRVVEIDGNVTSSVLSVVDVATHEIFEVGIGFLQPIKPHTSETTPEINKIDPVAFDKAKDLAKRFDRYINRGCAPSNGELKALAAELGSSLRTLQRKWKSYHKVQRANVLAPAKEHRVTPILAELAEVVPTDAYLTTLNLRFSTGKLSLDGQARSASDLITALEKSKSFKGVNYSSPVTRAGDKDRFSIQADIAR